MMMITPELLGLMPSGSSIHSDSGEHTGRGHGHHHGSKSWTQEDMEAALEALRNHEMSLTKASGEYFRSQKILQATTSNRNIQHKIKLNSLVKSNTMYNMIKSHYSDIRHPVNDVMATSTSSWYRHTEKRRANKVMERRESKQRIGRVTYRHYLSKQSFQSFWYTFKHALQNCQARRYSISCTI